MKKYIFLVLFVLFLVQLQAQNKRIKEVENNLIPYVPVKNFEGWNKN